jgi:hypothetical protein
LHQLNRKSGAKILLHGEGDFADSFKNRAFATALVTDHDKLRYKLPFKTGLLEAVDSIKDVHIIVQKLIEGV